MPSIRNLVGGGGKADFLTALDRAVKVRTPANPRTVDPSTYASIRRINQVRPSGAPGEVKGELGKAAMAAAGNRMRNPLGPQTKTGAAGTGAASGGVRPRPMDPAQATAQQGPQPKRGMNAQPGGQAGKPGTIAAMVPGRAGGAGATQPSDPFAPLPGASGASGAGMPTRPPARPKPKKATVKKAA